MILSGKALTWNLRPPFLNLSKAQNIYKWKSKEKVGNKSTTWNLYNKWFNIIHCPLTSTPKNIYTLLPCWWIREVLLRISAANTTVTAGGILRGFPNLSTFNWCWEAWPPLPSLDLGRLLSRSINILGYKTRSVFTVHVPQRDSPTAPWQVSQTYRIKFSLDFEASKMLSSGLIVPLPLAEPWDPLSRPVAHRAHILSTENTNSRHASQSWHCRTLSFMSATIPDSQSIILLRFWGAVANLPYISVYPNCKGYTCSRMG